MTDAVDVPRTLVSSHRDLIVWRKGMDLVVTIYQISAQFPRVEAHRLVDQITRAAVSVPANIAEGHARASKREFARFLAIAKGSAMEVETYLTVAVRLEYVSESEASPAFALITEVSKMLTALRKRMLED